MGAMTDAFARALAAMDKEAFQSLYGRWEPLTPTEVAGLLSSAEIQWWIGGGRAARVGAMDRDHSDTDVVVRIGDLAALRERLSDWDLWEANSGALRPLLPGDDLSEGCEQLWARRDADHPWQLDLPFDFSGDEWSFKHDRRIRVPWDRALHTVDGVSYLRPELALLHKAHLDRAKDRADLAAARLEPGARAWLAQTLDALGHQTWAQAVLTPGGRWPE
jgi:hypothetical protein